MIYSPDKIPYDLYQMDGEEIRQHTIAATIPLQYTQGFPCFKDSRTFWRQLPFESASHFELFQLYLADCGEGKLPEIDSYSEQEHLLDGSTISEIYHFNYWNWRVMAWMQFNKTSVEVARVKGIIDCETNHRGFAKKVLDKFSKFVDSEEAWQDVNIGDINPRLIEVALRVDKEANTGYTPAPEKGSENPNIIVNANNAQIVNGIGQGGTANYDVLEAILKSDEVFTEARLLTNKLNDIEFSDVGGVSKESAFFPEQDLQDMEGVLADKEPLIPNVNKSNEAKNKDE